MKGPPENLGPIDKAVLTFIGYKKVKYMYIYRQEFHSLLINCIIKQNKFMLRKLLNKNKIK